MISEAVLRAKISFVWFFFKADTLHDPRLHVKYIGGISKMPLFIILLG